MPLSRIRDVDVYHERRSPVDRGDDAPRLAYISGTGGDLRRRPGPFDAPLVEHFDMLAYDQRGLGRSAKPDRTCTMADYADDAAALMAVSFGGMVAQELALCHPGRVGRVVLCCTSSGGAGGSSSPRIDAWLRSG